MEEEKKLEVCDMCNGTGKVDTYNTCVKCGGRGVVESCPDDIGGA